MGQLLKWFSDIANALTGWLNLSEEAMLAVIIGLIVVGIVIAISAYKFVKKAVGKTIAIITLVAILVSTGFLSTAQIANFAEKIGVVKESSIGEGFEVDGDAFIDWIESKMPGADEGAGSWVPDKNNQSANDW